MKYNVQNKLNVVFMGTSLFSINILQSLLNNNSINIISVYTKAPKPAGRKYTLQKSDVYIFCENNNIDVHTPKTLRIEESVQILKQTSPDVIIVAAYGLIIPQNVLDLPKYGCINVHASALPRWRGAAPIQAAILHGDKKTGISIMRMDAGIDTGDVIDIQYIDILPKTNAQELSQSLSMIGAQMINDTLKCVENSLCHAYKQPDYGITYAEKLTKKDSHINWNNKADIILRQIMAFSPAPAAWTSVQNIRIKIIDANIYEPSLNDILNNKIGCINKNMVITCEGDTYLKLELIQQEGKKIVSSNDFINGHNQLVNMFFE